MHVSGKGKEAEEKEGERMKYIVILIFLLYSLSMLFTKNIGVKEFYLAASMILAAEYIDFAFKRKEENK